MSQLLHVLYFEKHPFQRDWWGSNPLQVSLGFNSLQSPPIVFKSHQTEQILSELKGSLYPDVDGLSFQRTLYHY
jgi:hypothetical protein